MRTRPRLLLALLVCALPAVATAQTTYTWNNSATGWNSASSWSPSGGPPGSSDTAQFNVRGTFATSLNNPLLNSSVTIRTLAFSNAASGTGWTLSGSGSLTAGVAGSNSTNGTTGLVSRGVGTYSVDLGSSGGTSTTLTLAGSTNTTLSGAVVIDHGSTLVLTGNTIAAIGANGTSTSSITVRGGTLLLDNSAGNPGTSGSASQRLTSDGQVILTGGGSVLQFKGATAGTSFTGLSGALSLGSGDSTVLLTQPSGAAARTTVTFGSLARTNTSATVNFATTNGTLGGSGTTDPRILFTTAPGLTNGVIAISNTSNSLGFAIYQGTDFANYDTTRGVIAATTTDVSGSLSTASTQNSNLTGDATIAASTTIAYNTLKINPSASGKSLAIGSSGVLNTSAILLAGGNDYSITGGSITGAATRYIYVPNASATLSISSRLGGTSQPLTLAGAGFITLTGTTNQVNFNTSQNVNLTGATLRVTSTNFDLTTTNAPTLRFRGGVIEYDVSGASFTFDRSLGTDAGNVNWTQTGTNNNVVNLGSGGFSAYASSSTNTNKLTVNLGGANETVTWGGSSGTSVNFVQDGYALKFGSTKSNATVVFDNPLALDGGTAGNYLVREVNVTPGTGVAADKTQFAREVSGSSSTDFLKTGNGVLEFTAANTYSGNTLIQGGELRVTGQTGTNSGTGTGNVVVLNGGLLSGTGQALPGSGKSITVLSGGSIRGGNSQDSTALNGTLTVGNTTIKNGGSLLSNLSSVAGNGAGTASKLAVGGNSLNLETGSILKLTKDGSFSGTTAGTFTLATFTSGDTLLLDGVNKGDGYVFGTYLAGTGTGTGASGAVTIDPSALSLANGDKLTLQRSGNNLVLVFTPVPEPASLLAACGLAAGGIALVRRLRRKPAAVTPAA